MIYVYIVNWLIVFVNALFSWLPSVSTLPFGMDTPLVTAFGYWNGFLEVVWPFQILWACVLWYYALKVSLLFIRMIPYVGNAV